MGSVHGGGGGGVRAGRAGRAGMHWGPLKSSDRGHGAMRKGARGSRAWGPCDGHGKSAWGGEGGVVHRGPFKVI